MAEKNSNCKCVIGKFVDSSCSGDLIPLNSPQLQNHFNLNGSTKRNQLILITGNFFLT